MQAEWNGQRLRIGNQRLMQESEVDWQPARQSAAEMAGQAVTPVFLSDDGKLVAVFGIADPLREDSIEAVQRFRKLGLDVIMLTGDNQHTAQAVAAQIGIDHVLAEVLPQDKVDQIASLQADGKKVAMVGDGINDAPTLAGADVSISFAHATELAQVNSGLLVLGGELGVIAEMRQLAKKIRRIIRQNLVWAASYNLLAVPAAALGFIAPWGAAIGMSLSSLLVVLNALRLRGR